MKALSRVGVIVATPLIILTVSFIAHAQGDAKGNSGRPSGYGRTGGSGPTTSNQKILYRVREKIVTVTPTTGTLTIVAESGASIRLQYLNRNGEVAGESTDIISQGERSIILTKLKPGRYRVIAELNGYRASNGSQEKEVIKNQSDKVEITLVPITYNVTVRLNASSGKLYYAKSGEVEKSVDIQNNLANLSNLIGGDYTIKVDPDDAAFKQLNTTLRVPGESVVSYTLDRLESRDFLGATASDWSLPGGWYFSAGKIMVKSAGVALPSDATYRNYKDFQLSAQAKMVNGVAASFVVHAVDPQNYYLIQITGQNADEPYVLRGYIVRNGSAQRFGRTIPISQFSETLKQGKFFQVILAMTGNEIVVKVQDSETGDLLKLGILPDPSDSFRIGAVGIAARNNEQNEISQFSICVKCQTP